LLWLHLLMFNVRERMRTLPSILSIKFLPGWGSGQYGPYGDPAGPGTPAQGEPVARKGRLNLRREPRTPFFIKLKHPWLHLVCLFKRFVLHVCDDDDLLLLQLQMYCFSTITHFYVCDCDSFNNLSVRLVLFINYFKLLQSLPTTQHIYELSFSCPMFVTTCSTEFRKWKSIVITLTDLKRATMRREMMSSTLSNRICSKLLKTNNFW
jgi:hypothetical protein